MKGKIRKVAVDMRNPYLCSLKISYTLLQAYFNRNLHNNSVGHSWQPLNIRFVYSNII